MLLALMVTAWASGSAEVGDPPAVSPDYQFVAVSVDHRIELLSLLSRLAGFGEFTEDVQANPFTEAADLHFEPWRRHKAVRQLQRLRVLDSIAYNAPASLAVHLDADLVPLAPLDGVLPGLDGRWNPRRTQRWLRSVRDFRERSEYDVFWEGQLAFRTGIEQSYAERLSAYPIVEFFDGIYGEVSRSHYEVHPSPLSGWNNYGSALLTADLSRFEPTVGVSPETESGEVSVDGGHLEVLIHEFGHAYGNPLMRAHSDEVRPGASKAFAHVRKERWDPSYSSWTLAANETLTRGTAALFVQRYLGPEAVRANVLGDQAQGFDWIRQTNAVVAEWVDVHEAGDVAGLPRAVAEAMGRWGDNPTVPPFQGPVNFWSSQPGPGFAMGPDPWTQTWMDRLWSERGLERLQGPPIAPGKLVLYGTPQSNAYLGAVLDRLGWSIDASGVTVEGHRFEGSDLVLIACVQNPLDGRSLLLYAASRDEDLEWIHQVFHGPTDWTVGKRADASVAGSGNLPLSHWSVADE